MHRIEMTPVEIATATLWATTVEKLVRGKENYTGLSAHDRYFHGYLGELAVARWLKAGDKLFQHRVFLSGRREESEFVVWKGGERKYLEVKTAADASHRNFMMPVRQRVDAAIYVGTRLEIAESVVVIEGALPRSRVEGLPVRDFGVPARYCPFATMDAPDVLLGILDGTRVMYAAKDARRVA